MVYYDTFDPFFTLFAGLAILCLGSLIVNRQAASARHRGAIEHHGRDISGRLLTIASLLTGLLVFALAGAEMLL